MKYKFFALIFTVTGFLASLILPIWAVSTQVMILRESGKSSVLETLGVTAGGIAIITFIVIFTVWRYFSVFIREKLKPQRTLIGFFGIGYLMILLIRRMMDALELIFLFGTIGATVAVICYFIADLLREKGAK